MKIRGVAHRGYPEKEPENTITSFQLACDLSFTHLELDVHLTKDGVPVLMHDYSINRMTNGKGMIRDYTLNELKKFNVKDTEKIPTLHEALTMLKGKISILIELKQAGDLYPMLEEKVLEDVQRTGTLDQVRIISFDHFSIAHMRELNPNIELGLICNGSMPYVFPFMKQINCNFLGVNMKFMTEKYAEMMHDHGIISGPWPINTTGDMEMIAEKYPNALITTDYLGKWADFYQKHPQLHVT